MYFHVVSFFVLLFTVLIIVSLRFLRSIKYKTIWFGPKLNSLEYPKHLGPDISYAQLTGVIGGEKLAVYMSGYVHEHLPWVIYCHGMLTNCESDLLIFEQLKDVANVLAWDYRGFGRSTGTSNEITAMYDLHYLITWLEEFFDTNTREKVILLGRSLGTNVILNYVRGRHVLPNRLILCHPFYSLTDVFHGWGLPTTLAYLAGNMDTRNVISTYVLKEKERKVLVLGTSEDNVTPWTIAQEETHDLGDQVILKDIGGDHFKPPQKMWDEIKEFIVS